MGIQYLHTPALHTHCRCHAPILRGGIRRLFEALGRDAPRGAMRIQVERAKHMIRDELPGGEAVDQAAEHVEAQVPQCRGAR